MVRVGSYVFKRADAGHELEAVHRLNYRTFVREIPQHEDAGTGRLVQIATMGVLTREDVAPFFERLEHWLRGRG